MGSTSLIDVLAVHADRLMAEPLPEQHRSGLVTALTAVPDRRDPRGVACAARGLGRRGRGGVDRCTPRGGGRGVGR